MTKLTSETSRKIVNFIIPYMDTDARKSIIQGAFSGTSLMGEIKYTGGSRHFSTHLIHECEKFGTLDNGEPAVIELLTVLRTSVGQDKQQYIDELINEVKEDYAKKQLLPSSPSNRLLPIAGILLLILLVGGGIFGVLQQSAVSESGDNTATVTTISCTGTIVISTGFGTSLNIVHILPRTDSGTNPFVSQGETVQILDSQTTFGTLWYQIRYSNGLNTGWIDEKYIDSFSHC